MKRSRYLLLLVMFFGPFASFNAVHSDEKLKIKNASEYPIEIRIFSEKELKWIKPAIKLDKGKSVDWKVKFAGDHNIKLLVNGKEHLMGTYDLRKVIKDKKIDSLEFSFATAAAPAPAKDGGGKSGGKKDAKTDVPKGSAKKLPGKKMTGKKVRVETRTRTVNVTKMRAETRTRTVTRADGTTAEVEFTVMLPYTEQVTQTYQVEVPVEEDGPSPHGSSGSGSKTAKPILTFKSKGKKVLVKDSLQKK